MPTPSVPVANETVSVLTNLQQLLAAGASPETVSQWVAEALVQHQASTPPDVTSPALHAVQQTQPTQAQPSHNITVISPSHARRDRPHSSRNTNIPNTTVQPPCPPRRGAKGGEEEDEEGNPLGQRSPRQCGHRVPISQKSQSQPQTMRLPTTTTTSTSIASPSHGVLPELKQSMTSIRSEVLEHRLRYNASTTTVGSHSALTAPCGAPGNESQSGPYMSQSHNTFTTTTATSLRPANATSESNGGAIAGRRLERNELHDITTVLGSTFSRTTDRYSTYTALRNTMNSSPNSAPVQSNSRNFVKDEPSLRQELLLQRQTMENSSTSAVGGGVRLRPLSTPLRPRQASASSTNATVRPCEQPSPQHTALNNIAVVVEEDSFTSPLATYARQAKTKGGFPTNNNNSAAYRAESADAAFVLRRTGRNGENHKNGGEAGGLAARVTHRVQQQQGQVSQGAENDERAAEEYDAGTSLDDFYLPLAEISVASSARWVPENKTRTPNRARRRRKQHPHSSPTQQQQQEQHSQGNSHRHRGHRGAHRSRKQRPCRRRSSSLTRPASQERRTTAVPSATTTTTTTTQALQVERDEESSGSVVVVTGGKKEKPTRKKEGGPCVTTQDGTEGIQEFARPPIQLPFPSSRRLRGSSVSFSCSLQSNTSRTPSPTLRRGGSGASGNSGGNGDRVPNENNNNETNNNEKEMVDGVTEGHDSSHRAAMAAATMRSRAKEGTSIHSRTNSSNRTTTTTTTTSGDEEEDEDSYYDEDDEEEDDVDNEESYVMSWGEASGLGEDSLAEHCRMRGALSGAEESKSMLEFNLASASGGGASVAHGASLLDLSRSATCGLAATSSSYWVHHAVPALVEDGSTTRSMTTQSQDTEDKEGTGNGTSGPCRTSVLRLDEGEEKGSRGVTMNNATAAMQEHLVRRVRVMPEFVLDGRCRHSTDPNSPSSHRHNTATTHSESCGCEVMSPLRFARLVIRDTYVRVPLGWTRARLADLGIPFIDGLDIDPASEPLEPYGTPLIMRLVQQYKERLYVYLCINILLRYSFAARFRFDLNKLHHFFQDTASYFRPGIALRNIVHATDTALAAHQWLCYHDIAVHFTDDEIFAFLFTAMMVNVGHTGVDNTVLTQIHHPYATVCGYIAPQQGATISLVLALLARKENHFFPSGTPGVADVSTRNTESHAVDTNKASAEAVAEGTSDELKPTTTTTSNGGGSNVPRPPSQPPRCSSGSGIPAANGSFARSTTTTALMTSAAACEWSAAMEGQFMDLFAELTMGRDLRNLNTINEQLARIAQESGVVEQSNTTGEGVLYDASAGRPSALHGSPTRRFHSSTATTHNAPRKAIVLTDAHVRPVLTAILYLVHYPHIFRNRTLYFTCSCLFSAQIYRQSRVQARYITFRTHRPASAPNININNKQNAELDTHKATCSAEAGKDTTKATLQSAADNKTGIAVTNESHETQNNDDAASKTMTTEEQLDVELDEMRRFLLGYPAHGIALDVLLVARETLYNPLLAKLTPYVPPSWIAAAEDNYSHLLAHLPSATMYDCCVGLALRSGQPAEPSSWAALRQWVPAEFDYDFLRDHIRVDPYWELNEEAFTRRVMQTIIQAANLDL